MRARFVLQGLDPAGPQIGPEVKASFENKAFNHFAGLVAFVSSRGAKTLADFAGAAVPRMSEAELAVGIDLGGTSAEALEELLHSVIKVTVFYTPSPSIFHPKVYLFDGPESGRLIVGSSNLTVPGWFTNLEASTILDLDLSSKDDVNLLTSVRKSMQGILTHGDSPSHGAPSLSADLIRELAAAGLVPAESSRKSPDAKQSEEEPAGKGLALSVLRQFRKLELPPVPPSLRPTVPPVIRIPRLPIPPVGAALHRAAALPIPVAGVPTPAEPALRGPLIWRKRGLPASDVQFGRPGTSPTGGLRLTQAGWQVRGRTIDQTSYFRNDVFGGFPWREIRTTPHVELARVRFHITVRGSDRGEHILEIRHKPTGEAGQGNYTTLISWGPIGRYLATGDYRGATLNLYGPRTGSDEPFEIEIA